MRQFLLKSLWRDEEGRYYWRFNVDAFINQYDQLRAAVAGEGFDGPTLFIKGELSGYIRQDNAGIIKRLFPRFQFKMIQNAGHWLHAEKPEAFNRLVKSFLAGD